MSIDAVAFPELSQEILDSGAQLRFQAGGNSMRPFIEWGDVVVVEPTNGSELHVGDVVFCRRSICAYCGSDCSYQILVHRIIKMEISGGRTVLITKGDNVPCDDFPFLADEVLGKVVQIESNGRRISLNGNWCRMLDLVAAWLSRHSYSPALTWCTRNLGRLYWLRD